MEKKNLFNKPSWNNGMPICKKTNLCLYLAPYTFTWEGPQVLSSTKPQTKKLLEEIGGHGDLEVGKVFLGHRNQ